MIVRRSLPLSLVRARQLRRDQTDAEQALWRRIRAQRLCGLKFRRQFLIGHYIVDFCCKECRLVVELDGGQHAEPLMAIKDERRTEQIEELGYRLIRFWNNEVFTNMDGVLAVILDAAAQRCGG